MVYPVHPPWDIMVEPKTVIIAPPRCYADFVAKVTMDYHDKPISIFIDEMSEGDWKGPGSLISGTKFDGGVVAPSKTENYETTIRIGVVSPWEKPPGEYRVRVYAYPAGENPFTYQVYDVLTVVIVDTGVKTCEQPLDGGGVTTIYTTTGYTTREWTVTTTTKTRDWWDWWRWWEWWGWLRWPWITREPFDFAVEATPATQSIKAGQQAAFTVYVTLVSGTPQPVTLSVPDICCGSTYSFSLTTGSPTFASALKVATLDSLKPGTYSMTITGSGGGKTHFTIVTLEVAENKKESIITISVNPLSLKVGEQVSVGGTLSPAHAATVELIYIRPDGFEMVKHINVPTSGVFSDIFKPDTPGLWSVKARWAGDANHYSCESLPASFAVEATQEKPPPQPSLWEQFGGLITLIIIALIIVVAMLLLRRRSKRLKVTPARASTMFCIKCGAGIPRGSEYCPVCGEELK
ncbi:MAG: zinc ribbon domain-containing protein [Candidatus Bathyarchaeia archaeon]